MSGLNKGLTKIEVQLRWDPSPLGEADHDLDIIAATYTTDDLHGSPAYLVHFDSRSPDGTIILKRDSRTGQGFGIDEAMTLELERLSLRYGRVVVGVAVQQREGRVTLGQVANVGLRIVEGYEELLVQDFAAMSDATAVTVAEFTRGEVGEWDMHEMTAGFDADPASFAQLMGRERSR